MDIGTLVSGWFDTANQLIDKPLAKGVAGAIALYVTYRFGLRAYFQQKQAENARVRYLDQGLDLAAAQLDYALGVFRHNWSLALRYIRLYRDAGVPVDISEFFQLFREVDQERFQVAPIHRIANLLDDPTIWIGYQSIFAFVGTGNMVLRGDLAVALDKLAPDPNHPNKNKFIESAVSTVMDLSAKSDRLYVFTSELMNLARVLEDHRLTRKDLREFRYHPDVTIILARLRERFPEWTKEPTTLADSEASKPMTPNTVEIRANIDTEQVRALQLINGGAAAGLMTMLPNIVENDALRSLTPWMVAAIALCGFGLFAATVHNRFRRKCSLEYDKAPNQIQPPARWRILRWCTSVPGEPRICTWSVVWMWMSMLAFLSAGASVASGTSRLATGAVASHTSCWTVTAVGNQPYKFNTCNGEIERLALPK